MPPEKSSSKSRKRKGDDKAKKEEIEVADDELVERGIVPDDYLNGICTSDNSDKPDVTVQEDTLINPVEKKILSKESLNLKEFEDILPRDSNHVQNVDSSNLLDKMLAADYGIPPNIEYELVFNIVENFPISNTQ